MAQQAGVRILVGDDYSGVFRHLIEDDPLDHQVGNYGREFAYYGEIDGLSPAEVLSWGTSNAGQLLVDPPARVGVIEAGGAGRPHRRRRRSARRPLPCSHGPEDVLKAVIRDGVFVIDRLPATRRASDATAPGQAGRGRHGS